MSLLHPYTQSQQCGFFLESESIQDVLLTSPGVVIKHVLLSRLEIRALDKQFSLLLQIAVASGDIDFIKLLVNRGINAAIIRNHQEIATELITHGADPNFISLLKQLLNAGSKPGEGPAALHLVVKAGILEATELLLQAGTNIDTGDSDHTPVLITACFNGDMRMVEDYL
ncbi:uncharacterized protein N7458_003986 [Penicillium daleae]|uniref:Ankyrin repeat protein n=1 Tax=Penicillium daleae TaxID=63821 RepID=A0AAD6G5E3_9EURO|nr:uncharacterized protein N7458_003986 [Penicillium daleae]KAJ5455722.1 hypothetical protein N7458_003986 [Penicillium daleae]